MPRKLEVPNRDDIIRRYLSGESLKQLANELGVSRGYLRKHGVWCPTGLMGMLVAAGVQLRGRSDAETVKWRRMSSDQRRHQVQRANTLRKGQRDSLELRVKRSLAWQHTTQRIGANEMPLIEELRARGIAVDPQYPLQGYNLDIALTACSVTVEVESGPGFYSRRPKLLRRAKDILDAGWSAIYVVVFSGQVPNVPAIADQCIAFVEAARSLEPGRGAYGVIGRKGQAMTMPRSHLDGLPRVPGF